MEVEETKLLSIDRVISMVLDAVVLLMGLTGGQVTVNLGLVDLLWLLWSLS